MSSILCSFTGTAGTLLESYSAVGQAAFTKNTAAATGSGVLTNASRARSNSTSPVVYYVNNWTPGSADYYVEATIRFASLPTSANSSAIGLGVRSGTTAYTGYELRVTARTGPTVRLELYCINTSTLLATYNVPTPPVAGSDHTIRLSVFGGATPTLSCFWDGAVVIINTPTGGNIITATGVASLVCFTQTGFIGDSAGYQMSALLASDNFTNITWTAADMFDNGYPGSGQPPYSAFSRARFTTNAADMVVTCLSTIYTAIPSAAQIGYIKDGVTQTPLSLGSNNTINGFARTLSGGSTITVELVNGQEAINAANINHTIIVGVQLYGHTAGAVEAPSFSNRTLVYGDSISVGFYATNGVNAGWLPLLRYTYGRSVMSEGWGSRCFSEDCDTAGKRTAFAALLASYNPTTIWIAIGTNDYGFNRWSAASFGTAFADFLDKLHTALPSARIYCQSPIQRISPAVETANGSGSTLGDYRSQISTAVSARTGYCTYVEGASGAIVSDGNMDPDGIHPATAGHAQYAAVVNALLPTSAPSPLGGDIPFINLDLDVSL